MIPTDADIREIQVKIAPLLGKEAWGASLGVGSFITLEFGSPIPYDKIPGRLHGEWHFWVTHCVWRLERTTEVIAGSEDPRPKLNEAIQHLDGLSLLSVHLTLPALETTFMFDSSIALRLFPVYTEEFEHWMLYAPDGNVLCVGPGSDWSYTDADTPYTLSL
jgi:hypothetical protein